MCFPKKARLKTRVEFDQVFANKKSIGTRYFVVYFLKTSLPIPRLGMIVSKRCAKKAVVRNRLRRQIREFFRQVRGYLISSDFVVIARHSATFLSNKACQTDLEGLFSRFYEHRESH